MLQMILLSYHKVSQKFTSNEKGKQKNPSMLHAIFKYEFKYMQCTFSTIKFTRSVNSNKYKIQRNKINVITTFKGKYEIKHL